MILEGKRAVWQQYQKHIPDDKFYYVRSCIRQNFFPGSEATFLRIVRDELGLDVCENACHTTCTGIGYHCDIVPSETTMTVVARQFALMTQAGYRNLVVSCITSFGLYTEILEMWEHHPEIEAKIRENLYRATGRTFEKPETLTHASDLMYHLRHRIAERAKYKLINRITQKPLRVVEHIGCHYAKMFPHKGVGGAEYPYVLVGMIEAWGGEVVDYPERRHCCGFGFRQYVVMANRGYSVSCSKKKFESMKQYQPDAIVTNCPGCSMFLDKWQYVIAEMEQATYGLDGYGIPVLTYEELAGLVLGYNPWDMGLQMHQVSPEVLLDTLGYDYVLADKYCDKHGKSLGEPQKPMSLHV